MAATVAGTMATEELPQGKGGVEHEEKVAEEILCGKGEEEIDAGKDGQ